MTQCLKTFWKVLFPLRNPCFVDILSMSVSLSPGHDLLLCLFNEWIWFLRKTVLLVQKKSWACWGSLIIFKGFLRVFFLNIFGKMIEIWHLNWTEVLWRSGSFRPDCLLHVFIFFREPSVSTWRFFQCPFPVSHPWVIRSSTLQWTLNFGQNSTDWKIRLNPLSKRRSNVYLWWIHAYVISTVNQARKKKHLLFVNKVLMNVFFFL